MNDNIHVRHTSPSEVHAEKINFSLRPLSIGHSQPNVLLLMLLDERQVTAVAELCFVSLDFWM